MATSFDDHILKLFRGNPNVHPVVVEPKLRRWYSTGNICNILNEAAAQSRFVVVDSGFMRKLIPARHTSDSHLYSPIDIDSLSDPSSGQITFASHGFGWQESNETSVSGSPEDAFGSEEEGLHMLVSPHQSEAAIQNGCHTFAVELREFAEKNRSVTMGDIHEAVGQLVTSASAPITFAIGVDDSATDDNEEGRTFVAEVCIDAEGATNQIAGINFIDDSDAE